MEGQKKYADRKLAKKKLEGCGEKRVKGKEGKVKRYGGKLKIVLRMGKDWGEKKSF